ncbi:BamA/TamA family outer membrane protein [Flammeovirgaceae bacterium SG7u.111]|nr:BamA/TamA family outer membrane protein [Flammeovirgaceae bacterium SG7u.132]WPO35830.1 BamA/TamA family outer membrane protein [Flammeovirgaceae bacterium SG7u.111]
MLKGRNATLFFGLLLVLILQQFFVMAQPEDIAEDSLRVTDIVLIGNKTTKDKIILRELSFKEGSLIPQQTIDAYLEKERNRVFNTELFVTVEFTPYIVDTTNVVVVIEVIERWYLLAVPLVDFADRNFNEWWKERGADLSRLEYGIKFNHRNFRGRREFLKMNVLFGFTKTLIFEYTLPFINKKQTRGMSFSVGISQNQDVAFKSTDNKLDYASASDRILIRRWDGGIGISQRSHFYNSHNLSLGFKKYEIDDSVAVLNPDYFLNGDTQQSFFELTYSFARDLRNNSSYPLKGLYSTFEIKKKGLGIYDDLNMIILKGSFSKFIELGKKFYLASGIAGKTSYPEVQPYNQLRGLGYNQQFVRGFDLYVIEGQHYGLVKNTFRWEMLSGKASINKILPVKQFSTIPYAIYLKTNLDAGYVHNSLVEIENSRLSNKPLYGGGLGVDIVSFYDSVFRIEYSINSFGETNFFIYYSASL